jgi:hypothetical protein
MMQYRQLPLVTVKEGHSYAITTTVPVHTPAAAVTVTQIQVVGNVQNRDPRLRRCGGRGRGSDEQFMEGEIVV